MKVTVILKYFQCVYSLVLDRYSRKFATKWISTKPIFQQKVVAEKLRLLLGYLREFCFWHPALMTNCTCRMHLQEVWKNKVSRVTLMILTQWQPNQWAGQSATTFTATSAEKGCSKSNGKPSFPPVLMENPSSIIIKTEEVPKTFAENHQKM